MISIIGQCRMVLTQAPLMAEIPFPDHQAKEQLENEEIQERCFIRNMYVGSLGATVASTIQD
ncbi:MAG TPA: hypothetical protein VFP59_10070 [Candidatus Angelobacter sp.]|nr:hypothetical protein [Candidatus Angelobacter sp.]